MIVATAGHIDHGKTHLVRALTGVDTDRLPEEKARGISIDLGFAYWTSPEGALLAFVDVPGHERFVRNMVAGACGIDFAMLVVAADDGVMPQTIEHVQILDLLGVRRGLAVITKIDRVDAQRSADVQAEVAALLAGTRLEGVDILHASPVSGAGVTAVAQALAVASASVARSNAGQNFRFAVDRVFTVGGSGTVVTGTVFSGTVATGASLLVTPTGTPVRVRRLHVDAKDRGSVRAGERCAINLAGVGVDGIARGDWVVDASIHRPTRQFDAEFVLLRSAHAVPTPATRLHLHIGASDVIGRLRWIDEPSAPSGSRALVRITTERPIAALHGDRFIVRDSAARRTLGGGTVLDPFAAHGGRRQTRLTQLAALRGASAEDALRAWLGMPAGCELSRFRVMFNLDAAGLRSLCSKLDVVELGRASRVGVLRERHDAWCEDLCLRLRRFHAQQPALQGMAAAQLHSAAVPALPRAAFDDFLRGVAASGRIVVTGDVVRLAEHDAAANPEDHALWAAVRPVLRDAGVRLLRLPELARNTGVDVRRLTALLYRQRAVGSVFRVGGDCFCLRTTLASLGEPAASLARASPDGSFTVAEYRDVTGIGRRLAVEILEALDLAGITLRVGETRRLRCDLAEWRKRSES